MSILKVTSVVMLMAVSVLSLAEIKSCDELDIKASYNDKFLKGFRYLSIGNDDWLFRGKDLFYNYGQEQTYISQIKQISDLLADMNIKLIIVPIPSRALIHPEMVRAEFDYEFAKNKYFKYLTLLRDNGALVPKIETLFKTHDLPLFFKGDHHWNHRGSREMAKLVANIVKSNKQYDEFEKYNFVSDKKGGEKVEGSLQKAYKLICNNKFKKEQFKRYDTYIKDEDLFSSNTSDIAIVGTSNSNGKIQLNFSGFISHYTKLINTNYAVSGGGYKQSISNFFELEESEIRSYKYIIWEFPSYYRFNDEAFLENIIVKLNTFDA